MNAEPIRVLVVDDHQLFRDGLKGLLQSAPDTLLLGEAASGDEALRIVQNDPPDVLLMDIQMEDSGISATRQIVAENPEVRVLMLTMFDDDHSVFAAMRAGARGYILKGARRDDVLRAIRAVAGGEAIFSPAVAARMVDFFAAVHPAQPPDAFPDLTEREREVLDLLARNFNNAQIAETLVISPKTVRNYVSTILGKLQAADRADAADRARDAGFG